MSEGLNMALIPSYGRQRKGYLAVVSAFLLLLGFIGFLVLINHRSQRKIQGFALTQLRQDAEKRAIALGYFFSERKYDLKNLAEQILTFSRGTEEEQRPLQPSLIVKEALKLLSASLPKNIKLEESIDNDTGKILADPTRLHQVVMNLCTNAAQAMRERGKGGTLGVSLGNMELDENKAREADLPSGSYIKLTISDTGPGIPEDILDRIFEPYFTTKAKGEGTGLGLSVVQGIVESYKGKILVESTPGQGTAFRVFFPRIKPGEDQTDSFEEQLPLSTGTEHILFVDDEPPLADIGKRILEDLGYRVTAMTNGREALSLFIEDPDRFDLVLTDLAMPDISGDELARELTNTRTDIPVILCSGFYEAADKERLSRSGISAFIEKPLTSQDLSKTVRRVLDQGKPAA